MMPSVRQLLLGRPAWVLAGADLDFDFARGRYYQRGIGMRDGVAMITVSRASEGYAEDTGGTWLNFASGAARRTNKGLLVEEARTNVVLHDRDLTNAAWTKSNVTAAKDQAGIDGVANSASSIAATAGNGTALQAITLASSARFQSAFVKRLVGSGTVEMTMDNGTTWTGVTVTPAWTRVTIPTQTLANPTVGFRIVTSGDAIAVDFVQNENSDSFATSPIATTAGAATRAADVVTVTRPPTFGSAYTLFGKGMPQAPANYGSNQLLIQADGGSATNAARLLRLASSGNARYQSVSGGVTSAGIATAWTQNVSGKMAASIAEADQAGSFMADSVATSSGGLPSGVSALRIGTQDTGAAQFNGYIERIALWPNTRLPNAELRRLTVP